MLAHDRRHAFGPWVFAAAAAYFLLHLYNILYMLNEPENPAILIWRFSGSMGLVPDAMPLIAALPAAAAFAVDLNSGFAVPAVLRSGTRRYLRSKLLAACIGGGLAPFLGRLLFVGLLHVLYRGDVAMAAEMFGPEGGEEEQKLLENIGISWEDKWKLNVDSMLETGIISTDIPVEDIFTNEFVDLTWDRSQVEADADAYDWQATAARYEAG